MSEKTGNLVVVNVSGDPVSLSLEPLTRIDDNNWQIATEAKRVVDPEVDPALEKDDEGIYGDIEYESLDKLSGIFTFAGMGHPAGSDIRVKDTTPTANYLPMSEAAGAHSYTYNRSATLLDVAGFGEKFKRRLKGLKFAAGTLSQWDAIDSTFRDILLSGDPVVLEFRYEDGADPERLWSVLESSELATAMDGAQESAVSFVSTGKLLNI